MPKSPALFSSDDEAEGSELEEQLLKKIKTMMQGVPPPPSITMPKLSVLEMLTKYNENKESIGFSTLGTRKSCKKENRTPLVYYFNSSKVSEEIANLSQKFVSRFVYSETMSSCNVWFEESTNASSGKKYIRSCLRLSPGSRLSHLAQRRKVFSSQCLQKLAKAEKKRQIQIIKPIAIKNETKKEINPVQSDKINSFKRALFLSPDDSSNEQHKIVLPRQDLVSSSQNISEKEETTAWFTQCDTDTSSSKKRKRLHSRERNGNWPRRALTFTDKDFSKNSDSSYSNMKGFNEIHLNLHHKTKILWAVSVTLKEKNINSKDSLFKSCASALFMICRKNLSKILNLKIEGGTSDKILHFARGHVDEILKKLNVSKGSQLTETDHTSNNIIDNTSSYFNQNSNIINSDNNHLNVLKVNYNESISKEHCHTFENSKAVIETAEISIENKNVEILNCECDKSSLLTLSSTVVNKASQEKENINTENNNYN